MRDLRSDFDIRGDHVPIVPAGGPAMIPMRPWRECRPIMREQFDYLMQLGHDERCKCAACKRLYLLVNILLLPACK